MFNTAALPYLIHITFMPMNDSLKVAFNQWLGDVIKYGLSKLFSMSKTLEQVVCHWCTEIFIGKSMEASNNDSG